MRFLILTQRFAPEIGAQPVRLAALARGLRRAGHEAEVVTALPNHPYGRIFPAYRRRFYVREERDGVTVHRVWLYPSVGAGAGRIFNYGSFAATALGGLLRAKRPDYLFVESPPLSVSVPAYVAATRWGVPFIFNVADLWPDSVRELGVMSEGAALSAAEWLEAWTYRKASYVTAVTEGIRRALREQKSVPEGKLLFLPNGVDTERFRPRPPDQKLAGELGVASKDIVLYAGSLGFAHGFEVALHAMERLQDRFPDLLLLCIGGGSEKKRITRMAHQMRLRNVRFLDPAPPRFIARLHSLAFAGLSTLRASPLFEGTRPAKMFVSMAAGKPVLYSGHGEGARLVEEAEAGIVTPPEDAAALAEAISTLHERRACAEALGRNGRRYVESRYAWDALVSDWLDQLLHKQPPLP